MKRVLAFIIAMILCLALCACEENIPDMPVVSDVTSDNATQNVPDNVVPVNPDDENTGERIVLNNSGTLYGSYLTMYEGEETEFPYIKVFDSYAEVSAYFDATDEAFFYGQKFTLALASFNDDYLAENDVMILVINESSSYISHKATEVLVTDEGAEFYIERHMPLDAPKSNTQYHLIFTAPNGSFDGLDALPFEVNITEVTDKADETTFDAERYRMIYPEYWPFVYRADAKGEAETVVDTITSYAELIGFYEQYNDTYDLEAEFKKHVGTLYDENSFFNEYVLLAIIVPSKNIGEEIAVDELFVYNLELYMSVANTSPAVVADKTECYVLATAVAKSDLTGVNLEWFNISFN